MGEATSPLGVVAAVLGAFWGRHRLPKGRRR